MFRGFLVIARSGPTERVGTFTAMANSQTTCTVSICVHTYCSLAVAGHARRAGQHCAMHGVIISANLLFTLIVWTWVDSEIVPDQVSLHLVTYLGFKRSYSLQQGYVSVTINVCMCNHLSLPLIKWTHVDSELDLMELPETCFLFNCCRI